MSPRKKKVAMFIAVSGSQTYSILKALVSPADPATNSINEIETILKNHFKPKTNEIAETYKFNIRNCHRDESISDYIVELKHMANSCNFGLF
jgi:hypothetical protein